MHDSIEPIAAQALHEKVIELVERLPGVDFLDTPSGYGALTQRLLATGKNVTAGDIDTDKFRVAENSRLRLMRLDLNNPVLPLADSIFDVAISVEGIEHLQSQWSFVSNLYRVTKPGGHLIITTPNILNFGSRLRYFMEGRYEHFKRPLVKGKSWSHDLENYHISPISFFEMQFMLESCGFTVLEVHTNRFRSRNLVSVMLRPFFRYVYSAKNRRDSRRNRGSHEDLYARVMSDAVYYGECLIILARKPA